MKRILVIDNADSFVYNVVEQLRRLGCTPIVIKENWDSFLYHLQTNIRGIILSPGAGNPSSYPLMESVIREYLYDIPMLGICLGHQAIAAYIGAKLTYLESPKHGHTSRLYHTGDDLFKNIPLGSSIGRYHSIIVDNLSLPSCAKQIAVNEEGQLMAFRIHTLPTYGVQFHPESIITTSGDTMMYNWLSML